MKKVLVTGAAGFIGMHLCKKIEEHGWSFVGYDNLNDYYDVNLKYNRLKQLGFDGDYTATGYEGVNASGNKLVVGDLSDYALLEKLFSTERFDYVVNLAAQAGVRYSLENPQAYISGNLNGFFNIMENCRNYPVEHMVFASSSSVYGLNESIPFRETDHTDHPVSLYAATKKSNEIMAHSYSHLFNIPSTGLRFFTVYGPWGRPDMALFMFTKSILAGEPINVFNHGDMIRDFTYVDDIVEGVFRLLSKAPVRQELAMVDPKPNESSAPYRIFNIGNSTPVHLGDFIGEIEEKLGKKAIINYRDMQPGDVSKTYADSSSLHDITGHKPATSTKDGISNFIDWYKNYFKVD